MRLAAWACEPVKTKEGTRSHETYEQCARCPMTDPHDHKAPRSEHLRRSEYRCCFMTEAEWHPPGSHLARHMGAPKILDIDDPELPPDVSRWLQYAPEQAHAPIESNADGCPGGWYRTEFWRSLTRFLRPVSDDGVYSSNRMLDDTDDRLVIEAVQAFESEQQRHTRWYRDRAHALVSR